MNISSTLVDPNVSRLKFDREVGELLAEQEYWRKERGWLIRDVKFPTVRIVFLETRLLFRLPRFAAKVDFTNYNILPLSVEFQHPVYPAPARVGGIQQTDKGAQVIMIDGHVLTGRPFLCLPGVREYHTHPMHNGDSWDLYRYEFTGTLFYILDNIWRYCVLALDPRFEIHAIRNSVLEYQKIK